MATPPDNDFLLPARRRTLFEHGHDLARMNFYLLLYSGAVTVCLCLALGVIISIIYQPPFILSDDEGYVMYRSTEVFRLDEQRVHAYIDFVASRLLNQNPGVYDLSEIRGMVEPTVISAFTENANKTADERLQSNRRRLFYLKEVKRYPDPQNPTALAIVFRGELADFTDVQVPGADGTSSLSSTRSTSTPLTSVCYLEQRTPTVTNPWGLSLSGIHLYYKPEDLDAAKDIWDRSVPLYRTVLPDGTLLNRRERNSLTSTGTLPVGTGTKP